LLLKITWVFNLILSGNFVLQVVPQADRVLIRLEELPEVCLLFYCLCFSVISVGIFPAKDFSIIVLIPHKKRVFDTNMEKN
jgi:hypothetical protein